MDVYGIIGWPVEHSLSPAMHNAAFKKLGMEDKAKYIKIPVKPEELEDFLLKDIEVKDTEGNSVRTKEILGFNITIPHKVRAKEMLEKKFPCDLKDPYARTVKLTGAVNTVKRVGDEIQYLNTDVSGFMASLEKDLGFKTSEHKRSNILILGCGGAARAVIASLLQGSIGKIYVYDIDKQAMDSTKRHFASYQIEFISQEEIKEKITDCQLLVNATPIGMKEGDPSPLDKRLLRKNLYVYDIVYNRKTQFVKDAELLGANAVTGEGMLAWQGAIAFSCWIDKYKPADVIEVMRKELDKALKNKFSKKV